MATRDPRAARSVLAGVEAVTERLACAVGDDGERSLILRGTPSRWTRVKHPRIRGAYLAVGGGCVWAAASLSEPESNSAVFRRCGSRSRSRDQVGWKEAS